MPEIYATEDNSRRNRATLIANTRRDLSLPADLTLWTVEQRFNYTQRLATFVVNHVSSFTEEYVAIARQFLTQDPPPPEFDTSYDWGMFANEVVDNAATVIPKVGFAGAAIAVGILIVLGIIATQSTKGAAAVAPPP